MIPYLIMPPSHRHTSANFAYVIDVDMGYGHARAAHALRHLSGGKVITANEYDGMTDSERTLWKRWKEAYETLSRLRPVPIIGNLSYQIVEKAQEIPAFYPRRDLSKPNLAVKEVYRLIERHGLGRELTQRLNKDPRPVICTHPVPAFALEVHGYRGAIWCVPTDTDVARPWVAREPKQSRIRYCCANGRLMERLQLYGVQSSRLTLTGFPLPPELIGGVKSSVLKHDLARRLAVLDPMGLFREHYRYEFGSSLSDVPLNTGTSPGDVPLVPTLMYCVGGAGAQREIGKQLIKSLTPSLQRGVLKLILVAGTRKDVAEYYSRALPKTNGTVEILCKDTRATYFESMNEALHRTDILWTKPSELAFYTALGIPVVMAPPLGRQEEFNAIWLTQVGGGMMQGDPRYANEWLFDWLNSGGFARAAWNGYIEAPTHGTYRIEDAVRERPSELEMPPLIV